MRQQHSGREELLWKLMRFPVFEMKMESWEWENWLSLQRCPSATATFGKPSCFSILNEKAAWTGSEQMQFAGSISDWCSSLRREFTQGLAEPVGSMNSSRYSKETHQSYTNLSIVLCTVLNGEGMQGRPENLKAKHCSVGCLAPHTSARTQSGKWELVQSSCCTGRAVWAVKVTLSNWPRWMTLEGVTQAVGFFTLSLMFSEGFAHCTALWNTAVKACDQSKSDEPVVALD